MDNSKLTPIEGLKLGALTVLSWLRLRLGGEIPPALQTPEFWEKYKKDHPTVDMSKWPPQARAAFDAAVKEHNKKK